MGLKNEKKKQKEDGALYSRKAIDAPPEASSTAARVAVTSCSPILIDSFLFDVLPHRYVSYMYVYHISTHRPTLSTWHPHFSAAVTLRAVLTALRNANRIKGLHYYIHTSVSSMYRVRCMHVSVWYTQVFALTCCSLICF